MVLILMDFKSGASTDSATSALGKGADHIVSVWAGPEANGGDIGVRPLAIR